MIPSKTIILTPRPIPYPYRAMFAICSDLDETSDRSVYREIMQFLNTTKSTAMGNGVGLEVGNSIYFDMPPNQFAYWNTDEVGRQMVRAFIRSGHIDCLHSFGDLAVSRKHAARALDELSHYDCRLKAWIDHSIAPTNFGSDIMQGHGDEPGHEAYHADLTTQFGIRYIWRGRVSSVIGQEVPSSLRGLWTPRHPFSSTRTLAKEWAKYRLGRAGNTKYRPHALNCALYPVTLRDGRGVYEFIRANPYWKGVGLATTASGLGDVLTSSFLDRLAKRNGCCILYTHLGKTSNPVRPFDSATCKALYHLADRMDAGEILTTTTTRLLDYLQLTKSIIITAKDEKTNLNIVLKCEGDLPLHGLTFEAPDCNHYTVTFNGRPINFDIHRSQESVIISIPWPKLTLPEI